MGSPRRVQRDQERRVDIKDRLQALAKTSTSEVRKTSSSANERSSSKSQNSSQAGKDRGRNDKNSSRKDSIERVMERARTEGGARWTKKLLDEEAKDPDRWGHSGFKEMYKNELGMNKSRRSRSREKPTVRHSRSRERSHKTETGRSTGNRERSGGGAGQRTNTNSRKKRSRSSSDRSLNPDVKWRTDSSRLPGNGSSTHERKSLSDKVSKSIANRLGRSETAKKSVDRRREVVSKKERIARKRSPVPSSSRSRSPLRQSEKMNAHSKKQNSSVKAKVNRRGPVSPPERRRSNSGSQSRSTSSPIFRRRNCPSDEASSRSSSSLSRSSLSRSTSSSSSSSESSTSLSSRETGHRKRTAHKPRSPPVPPRMKVKEQLKTTQDVHNTKQNSISKTVKRSMPTTKTSSSVKKRRTHSDSDSSSNGSSSDTEDEDIEEGEDNEDCEREEADDGSNTAKEPKSGNLAPRLSLSERFGKLAQLSSQRRNLELVQLRIVAPVGGANTTEKNVSIDENSAAPVITNSKIQRERSNEPSAPPVNHHHHQLKNVHPPEEPIRKDERARDDRWRDWHERYDQYRHVQPPRQLPRDWDDIRVRHKYYTDRGYFGHDMTLEELSRWEAWWHRYQQWRRGYEHAWVKTHGPHVPVEYPDWTHYRSTNNRGEIPQLGTMASSIRSRLGWRR